jgi:hypothetical protein
MLLSFRAEDDPEQPECFTHAMSYQFEGGEPMQTVRFIGRVLPPVAGVTVELPDLKWKWEEHNLEPAFRVKIGASVINIECDLDRYEATYFDELYRRATDLSRVAVNVVAFASGHGLTVVLETFIDPRGMPSIIFPTDPRMTALCTAYSLDPSRLADLGAVYSLILTEPPLFRALNDLIESISVPHVAPVNCGRVVDGIRRMITPPTSSLTTAQAWQAMHNALNVSRVYLEWISNQSTGPRHGDPTFVPGNVTMDVTLRTWTIMNRFLEYRKRSNTPLAAPEFPLL